MEQVELALRAEDTIGESPFWCAAERALYWIDVKAPALFRLDPDTGDRARWDLPADVGAYALERGDTALVALRTGLFRLALADGALSRLAPPPFDPGKFRFNEGKCDRAGRFWIGVMFDPLDGAEGPPAAGALHVWTDADGLHPVPDSAELHNGMGWDARETLFFVSHSHAGAIREYRYDASAGRIGRGRVFARVPAADGIPDGAAIDAEGGYWCALHGGWKLRRFHADGRHDRDVPLPVSQPTMPCFGGADLDVLFVTSAADGLDAERRRAEPLAGSLFRFRPGVPGIAAHAQRRPRAGAAGSGTRGV